MIWSAPFWGLPDFIQMDPVKIEMLKLLSLAIDEFVINSDMPLHKVSRNRTFFRSLVGTTKSVGLNSLGFPTSCLRMIDLIHAKAKNVTHPYLLVLGEKDVIVNNRISREWHSKTQSKVK